MMFVNYLREYYSNNGLTAPIYHSKSRPVYCEGKPINRMLNIAKMAGDSPLYIVHLSCKLGLDYIKMAIDNGQKNIFYRNMSSISFLDESKYNDENNEGLKYMLVLL